MGTIRKERKEDFNRILSHIWTYNPNEAVRLLMLTLQRDSLNAYFWPQLRRNLSTEEYGELQDELRALIKVRNDD